MSDLRQDLIRSVHAECGGPRAVPLRAATFEAFQIAESGRTYPIEGLVAGTLEDAKTQAVFLRALHHKQHLLIKETRQAGVRLHLFAVKRKAQPRYVHGDHVTKRVHDLYLAPVCSIDGGVL